MTRADAFERELENLDKEICRMEQLGLTSDKYYYLLIMERLTKINELQYCIENNL